MSAIIHICMNDYYRLRLEDGSYIFMEWHRYCGPQFFKDRAGERLVDEWWENPLICNAVDWFVGRGEKA